MTSHDQELQFIAFTLLTLGAAISVTNAYLSFFRFRVHRLRGGTIEDYRWASGIPIIGSIFLVASAVMLRDSPIWFWSALGLAAIDTGGPHWFLGIILWHSLRTPRV